MDQQEFANGLKAGIGNSKLWRLRRKTAIATARDLIAVGHRIVGAVFSEGALDSADAMGFLLQMAGELMLASANLLSNREIYAGAALLRQVTEIEYLTWAIKEPIVALKTGCTALTRNECHCLRLPNCEEHPKVDS